MKRSQNYLFTFSLALAGVFSILAASPTVAADNCFTVGQAFAQEQGASLVAAEQSVKDGTPGCEIVVLTRAENGQRPKREVVFLPN